MPPALRIVSSLLFVVMAALAGSAWGKTILVYGDSLSAAYGLAAPRGWVALLGERLKRERLDYSVANASISGETTAGGLSRFAKVLEREKPSIVVLELGANDGLRGLPVAVMKKNLAAMIQQAHKAGASVLLVGMRMPPNYGEAYTQAFERSFAELAKEHRVALLPFLMEGFADKPDYFQADRIHPAEAAQPLILDSVWRALAPLLKGKKPRG